MTFRFREWPVYNDSRKFRLEVNQLMKKYFPKDELYLLIDQIRRALNSLILNIAEGANRTTDKDTNSFINRALTSLDEVVAGLDCAHDDGYIDTETFELYLIKAENIAKQLRGFSNHLMKTQ
jgi:four helix bundle protein